MKLTNISMEWTDTGAVISISSTSAFGLCCPRCGVSVGPGEHRCGDKVLPKPVAKLKRRAASQEGK